jgi:predicted MFS family arabinose efflux permease
MVVTRCRVEKFVADKLIRCRVALSAVFFMWGGSYAMWGAHIPTVQARLSIEPAVLGLALLAFGVGCVVAQPVMALFVAHSGSRFSTVAGSIANAVIFPTPILAPSIPLLFAATFAFGFTLSMTFVAANTQASEYEIVRGRPTMSSFHGFFSLGALAGAAAGGAIVAAGWGKGSGAVWTAAGMIALTVAAAPYLLSSSARKQKAGPVFALPTRAVLVLAAIAFLCNMVEGAVMDWSALLLAIEKGASPGGAAVGLTMYTAAMAAMRLSSGRIVQRLGEQRIVTLGALLMAAGVMIAVLSPAPFVSALGFGLVGIGAANNVPVLVSAGGRAPGVIASVGVAAVGTAALIGFLISPPLIGFVANFAGLDVGVGLLAVIALAGAAASAFRKPVTQ